MCPVSTNPGHTQIRVDRSDPLLSWALSDRSPTQSLSMFVLVTVCLPISAKTSILSNWETQTLLVVMVVQLQNGIIIISCIIISLLYPAQGTQDEEKQEIPVASMECGNDTTQQQERINQTGWSGEDTS